MCKNCYDNLTNKEKLNVIGCVVDKLVKVTDECFKLSEEEKSIIAQYANRVAHDNFDKSYSLFDSCAAKYVEHSEQLWIVDVDKEDIDINNISIDDLVDNYIKVIE